MVYFWAASPRKIAQKRAWRPSQARQTDETESPFSGRGMHTITVMAHGAEVPILWRKPYRPSNRPTLGRKVACRTSFGQRVLSPIRCHILLIPLSLQMFCPHEPDGIIRIKGLESGSLLKKFALPRPCGRAKGSRGGLRSAPRQRQNQTP